MEDLPKPYMYKNNTWVTKFFHCNMGPTLGIKELVICVKNPLKTVIINSCYHTIALTNFDEDSHLACS